MKTTCSLPCLYLLLLLAPSIVNVKCAPSQQREQLGPCIGMDCMHGVLMHGDDQEGHDHKSEDNFRRQQEDLEATSGSDKSGPCKGMDCLHGVLMHKDAEAGVEHMHQDVGPQKEAQQAGPGEGMEFLHGVMMHGDSRPGKSHEEEEGDSPKARAEGETDGPCVGMDCLHGVLMHGDGEEGHDHSAEHKHDIEQLHEKLGAGVKSNSPDIEGAMHGGDDADHVHSHDNKPEIDEKHKGVPSISDPNEAFNGDLNKQLKLGEAPDTEDEGYLSWLRLSKKKGKKDSAPFLGFSFPFISDSLLDNIEILKRRYLPKFWGGTGNDVKEGVASDMRSKNDDDEGEVHELISDLDVVGNTGPISEHQHRHHPKDVNGGANGEGSGIKHDEP